MRRPLFPTLAATLACAAFATVAEGVAPGPPQLDITLEPGAPATDGSIPYLDVVVQEEPGQTVAGQALLKMPLVTNNVVTTAEALTGLAASDATGPLALSIRDDLLAGPPAYRHWIASRAVSGRLTLRYRAPITNALPTRGAAPPLDLRTDEGGFGGAGGVFLILPESATPYRTSLHWKLDRLAKGAVGLSSLGPGDVAPAQPLTSRELEQVYIMAGTVGRYPIPTPKDGFFSAWEGTPPFDATALMAWTRTLHDRYVGFFGGGAPGSYAVFLRRNLVNAGGGVELNNAFIGSYGKGVRLIDFKITLAHEMFHTWAHGLDGDDGLAGSWFSEGLAVFYERRLPLKFGQITPDEFLTDLNTTAGRYYTDSLNTTPNSEIPHRFWADTRIRVLPYDRGAMYFSVIDSEVRKATGGRRSLDDLLHSMLARRQAGKPMDQAAWVETVTQALGARGRTEFDAMLAGGLMLPDSDAFGPCFRRTTRPLRRYELGFEPAVLAEPARIVRGLVAGSAAEAAGLRNGDQIVRPVPQDQVQADQSRRLTLEVRRAGQVLSIDYLPRGETVQAYQWERISGIKDSACTL